jgi:WD40 repeat protein
MAMLCQLPGERGIFSPAGDVIVTAHRGGSIQLFDIETCELIRSIEAGEHPLAFSISPDGRSLAFAEAACCVIQIQDLATGELLARHSMPGNREITFLAYSPSGEYLLSFSWAAKSTLLQDWRLHTWEVNVAAP